MYSPGPIQIQQNSSYPGSSPIQVQSNAHLFERTVKFFSPIPPVVIHKIFENRHSDPDLIRQCKSCIFVLPYEAKELLELFCL